MKHKFKVPFYGFENIDSTFVFENNYGTKEESEAFDLFIKNYHPEVIFWPRSQSAPLVEQKSRFCIFCRRGYGETKFSSEAHVVPKSLGNRDVLHFCECDSCNERFSVYENELCNYLGPSRTLSSVKKGNKVPKFKSPDGKIIVQPYEENDGKKGIEVVELSNLPVSWENGEVELFINTHKFRPIDVMKAFWKIGFSLIPPNEVNNYGTMRTWLLNDQQDKQLAGLSKVVKSTVDKFISAPLIIVWKRRNEVNLDELPTRSVYFYIGNTIFQYFMPSNDDRSFFKPGSFKYLFFPPPNPNNCRFKHEKLDFSGLEKISYTQRLKIKKLP